MRAKRRAANSIGAEGKKRENKNCSKDGKQNEGGEAPLTSVLVRSSVTTS